MIYYLLVLTSVAFIYFWVPSSDQNDIPRFIQSPSCQGCHNASEQSENIGVSFPKLVFIYLYIDSSNYIVHITDYLFGITLFTFSGKQCNTFKDKFLVMLMMARDNSDKEDGGIWKSIPKNPEDFVEHKYAYTKRPWASSGCPFLKHFTLVRLSCKILAMQHAEDLVSNGILPINKVQHTVSKGFIWATQTRIWMQFDVFWGPWIRSQSWIYRITNFCQFTSINQLFVLHIYDVFLFLRTA